MSTDQASEVEPGSHLRANAPSSTEDRQVVAKVCRYPEISIGTPYGGDSNQVDKAPPIGFLLAPQIHSQAPSLVPLSQTQPVGASRQFVASNQSLYEGDTWSRAWFQRVMILSLIRLLIFIRKVYEDFQATKTYNRTGQTGHFLVAAMTLFLPTIVFTIYRLTRYLQFALPSRVTSSHRQVLRTGLKKCENDNEVSRALMDANSPVNQQEDDGLVTARQTPTILEEYHDSHIDQHQTISLDGTSPAPSTAIIKDSPEQTKLGVEPKLESVEIDKLGNIPDKETTRIVIGASEQILHGGLFVFWQLKRQVDVLAYLVERSCLWRKPCEEEKGEIGRLQTGSDGLEWFQDFYAAFLAILAQVYTLGLYWASGDVKPERASALSSASGALNTIGAMESSEISISRTAKAISETLRHQALAGSTVEGSDLLIMSELLVSTAVVFSLLVAVRRRDDGPLTLGLSMIGWGSMFASRIIVIALAFVYIGPRITSTVIVCHILIITVWIYKIAIDSHNNKISESEEHRWEPEVGKLSGPVSATEIELEKTPSKRQVLSEEAEVVRRTILEHIVSLAQVLTLFAIPSLFYWPIMFNLKLHYRPFKYLVLVLTENFILIPAIWFSITSNATLVHWYLLGAVGGFSIVGFIFISLYVACKPGLTEYFARADELFNEAEKSGVYYEFCSRIFKLPDLSAHAFKRLMNQSERVEVIED